MKIWFNSYLIDISSKRDNAYVIKDHKVIAKIPIEDGNRWTGLSKAIHLIRSQSKGGERDIKLTASVATYAEKKW